MNYRHYLKSAKSWVFSLLIITTVTFGYSSVYAADAAKGEKLFKANCASCHRVDSKKLTGPGLAGVMDRVPDMEWVYKWVKNSKKLIDSGDSYANEVYNEYNKVAMTPFEYLSNEQIDDIFEYVQNPPVQAAAAEEVVDAGAASSEESDGNAVIWLIVLIIVFLVVINVLWGVKRSLTNLVRAKQGLDELPDDSYAASMGRWINEHKRLTAIFGLIIVVVLARAGWDDLKGVGVYQAYAPEQPIKFSHKIHAGDNGIDCVYCHHSAEKGRSAGIPSVNVCMNCHKAVSEGKRWGEEEISKIYAAAGFNSETGEYDKPEKPVKWIKIHNLPDFVYFNHSQHVVVGKQKCQTCHGEVESFDYPMKQESELTMGWCINCHRETGVDSQNPYYEKMHAEFKEKYEGVEGKTFNVEAIGGLECAKCHY